MHKMEANSVQALIEFIGHAPILVVMGYFLWRIDRRIFQIEMELRAIVKGVKHETKTS